MRNKITLFLMNQKGFYVLSRFIEKFSGESIDAVIASEDAAIQHDYYAEIKNLCAKHHITFHDRNDPFKVNSSFCFAIGWRWLIPLSTTVVVFHDSLLPKYRGFNPLVSCLINGENEIGVSAVYAGKDYDTGEILAQAKVRIEYPIKIQDAIDKLCPLYLEMVASLTTLILNNEKLNAEPQAHPEATYSLWRDEHDYHIDWHQDAHTIKRFIDAVGFPYNGAYSLVENKKVYILSAEVLEDVKITNRTCGKIIFMDAGHPVIVCKEGLLKITTLIDDLKNSLLPLDKFRLRFC
jgi:methionyl-tRNA formyltransferase